MSEDFFLNYLLRCAKIGIIADTKLKLRHVDVDSRGKVMVYPPGEFPPIPAEDEEFGKDIEVVDLVIRKK